MRYAEETFAGWKSMSAGYTPPMSMTVLKVCESLFEGVPQAFLQTYMIAKLAIADGVEYSEPTITQYFSVVSSVFGIGLSLATLGRGAAQMWRLAFLMFVAVQALLRIVTLCMLFAILAQQETDADMFMFKSKTLYLLASLVACLVAVLLNVRPPIIPC